MATKATHCAACAALKLATRGSIYGVPAQSTQDCNERKVLVVVLVADCFAVRLSVAQPGQELLGKQQHG